MNYHVVAESLVSMTLRLAARTDIEAQLFIQGPTVVQLKVSTSELRRVPETGHSASTSVEFYLF